MENAFSRTEMLLGEEAMKRLAGSRVAVFGLGGVGGYVVEALARSDVGALDLVDDDLVCLTNLNRQIIATRETIGRRKTEVCAERVQSIAPECRVTLHEVFVGTDTIGQFDFAAYDYVVDAVDTVTAKLLIIERSKAAGTPVISCMGAGNKLDPTAFRVADIEKTKVCPLARVMRRELKKRGIRGVKVVYSEEEALRPEMPEESDPAASTAREGSSRRATPGSIAFVPSVAGLVCAGEVIRDLAGIR